MAAKCTGCSKRWAEAARGVCYSLAAGAKCLTAYVSPDISVYVCRRRHNEREMRRQRGCDFGRNGVASYFN